MNFRRVWHDANPFAGGGLRQFAGGMVARWFLGTSAGLAIYAGGQYINGNGKDAADYAAIAIGFGTTPFAYTYMLNKIRRI